MHVSVVSPCARDTQNSDIFSRSESTPLRINLIFSAGERRVGENGSEENGDHSGQCHGRSYSGLNRPGNVAISFEYGVGGLQRLVMDSVTYSNLMGPEERRRQILNYMDSQIKRRILLQSGLVFTLLTDGLL